MKNWIAKVREFWAAFNEIAMAPIAFVVFAGVYALIAWWLPDVPLPGPSRLVGPMWGAFLVFVGWAAGTFSFYWNCRERFEFLFGSGPEQVFETSRNKVFRNKRPIEIRMGLLFKESSTELFRCHVLYLWHCSIFVFGLVLSQ